MKNPVSITSIGTISPLGSTEEEIWKNYKTDSHLFSKNKFQDEDFFVGELPISVKDKITALKQENSKYRNLDNSVLNAIMASRMMLPENVTSFKNAGINIGSSRGATGLFEKYHSEYVNTGKSSTYSSPSTTLGNISSWVAQDLQSEGPEFSHSVTCSTGMHAILNGIAWMGSGMAESFLVGGSEAPLTGFTLAQMKAMKIYAAEERDYPCRSLDMDKRKNSMILSEAAGLIALEKQASKGHLVSIRGIGYANEKLKHGASLSRNGECLQKSMKMAMGDIDPGDIDIVVMHAPGTIGGDLAEVNAVKNLFGSKLPAMTSNKWKTGHSFAASGILSLEMAVLMLRNEMFLPVPFSEFQQQPKKIENILVNSVGFGGNSVSILIGK
ncbi:beta-ketoacyl synthase N-terminal-like domain-containing protein [Christiangramia salexigens]|uniref:Beta-ketoacyl synthase n=1 Tax=Christiangramia salexigens TaxID=1913577 RepID=A0A1L3J608_9FLAO|nr:beta-ketoacyl synthase N-terminal-like domain-containing protein [Christiangramia salexigens]APG60579.1 beta-ketoacyl synthase [Christiangramia salexigens]